MIWQIPARIEIDGVEFYQYDADYIVPVKKEYQPEEDEGSEYGEEQ